MLSPVQISPDITRAFFLESDSEQLAKIHQWARARRTQPWAVFIAVLLRVAASVGPHVQLPAIIGERASLNMFAAFVSASGGGKGAAMKVSRRAWPGPVNQEPIGSGEGIAAAFLPPAKEDADNERITSMLFDVPEIDTLTGLASRQGSILVAQLKSAWMGEQLGQRNAQKHTTRIIPEHSYRLCLAVGAQPGHCDVIFNDASGGSPQRFLWLPTEDPYAPDKPGTDPAPLDTAIPFWAPGPDGVVEIVYGPPEIAEAIDAAYLARNRGQASPLDGHALLSRCKVAAGIALMHHRSIVSAQDWELSGIVMAVSDQTRQWLLDHSQKANRAKIRERAQARAAGEDFYDASRLETVKRSIIRMLDRDGEQVGGDLRRRLGKREKRELFDQAIALLESEGMVTARRGEHGSLRYTIGSPVTKEVTPKNPSSEGVTSLVTRDHFARVIDLDNPSSDGNGTPTPPSGLTCRQWLDNHVADLIAGGTEFAESSTVYAAGVAAGYTIDNLRQCAKACPAITVKSRAGRATTWQLGTGSGRNEMVTALSWLTSYLTQQTEPVPAATVYAAGEEAGYGRDAIKAAGHNPSITKHGQSILTRWSLDNEQESA